MKCEIHTADGETWHILYLSDEEANRICLPQSEAAHCHKRNGGNWVRHDTRDRVLKPEVDAWLREVAGHRLGEIWECDRIYYPDEVLPELPRGGHGGWIKHFRNYVDENRSYYAYGWDFDRNSAIASISERYMVCFHEGFIKHHKIENLPTIFAMLFL
jgi:hypothetical protein